MDISKIVDINKYSRWSGNNYRIEKNAPNERVIYDAFKNADVDKDGSITLHEYLVYLHGKSPQLKIDQNVLNATDNIDELENSKDEGTRRLAANDLGESGDKIAVPALIHSMRHDNKLSVQEASVEALGKIRGETAELALIDALLKDEDWRVRAKAAVVLGGFFEETAASALIIAIRSDDEFNVRNSAARSLINIQNNINPESRLYGLIKKALVDLKKEGRII